MNETHQPPVPENTRRDSAASPKDPPEYKKTPSGVTDTALDQARIEAHKLRVAAFYERWKVTEAEPLESCGCDITKLTHAGFVDMIKGSADRSIERSKFVATAATGISGIYTALLALVFANTDPVDEQLDWFAVVPGVFIALGLAFALAGVAAVRASSTVGDPIFTAVGGTKVDPSGQLSELMKFANKVSDPHPGLRVASIAALFIGLTGMPFVFVDIDGGSKVVATAVAVILLFFLSSRLSDEIVAKIPVLSQIFQART